MTTALPFELERTVRIGAPPETVFAYFTDSERWAAWWGAGSEIDARPGGALRIRYPNAIEAIGTVLAVEPPHRIVFTMGYPGGTPFPPEASRVTITLESAPDGTRLRLTHEAADAAAREQFVQGWRYQLSLFANVVLDTVFADAASRIDDWFAAVSLADEGERGRRLAALAAPDVVYRDRYSALAGVDDLVPHVGAMHRFMPGFAIARRGAVRHRQGAAVADWAQTGADGRPAGEGTAVVEFAPDGRVGRVTLFGG